MKYLVLAAFLLPACNSSKKVYEAPAMGAESQFDKGLRPEKHPQYLFDKKTMKDLEERGTISDYSSKRRNTAPTAPLPGKGGGDSTAAPLDSSAVVPDSLRAPADSAHIPL
jgi:hypothetical protein